MSNQSNLRRLRPGDKLYRKMEKGAFHPETGEVFDEAFIDNHPSQSFNVDRVATPADVLRNFCKMRKYRERFGIPNLSPADLIRLGIGVCEITVADVIKDFEIEEKDGHQFDKKKGHVNVIAAKERPWLLAEKARALKPEEILPGSQ